jgi:hypothetical protein
MTTERDKLWHQQYEKLVEYKRNKGDYMVPFRYEQDKSLGAWVNKQRSNHNDNKLRQDRTIILDGIGFAWKAENPGNTHDKLWHQQYELLVEFKRKNGHCMVPKCYKQDKSLGRWVGEQRKMCNNNKIRLDRKRISEEIGFAWKDDGAHNYEIWHKQYEKLIEFKRKNGHCMVPTCYKQDKSLWNWISDQRTRHIKNKMRPDRKELLDELESERGKATGSCSPVGEDGVGRDDEDSKPSLVTSSAPIGSYSEQEVVQEEATTTPGEIPSGWTLVKLEPDC